MHIVRVTLCHFSFELHKAVEQVGRQHSRCSLHLPFGCNERKTSSLEAVGGLGHMEQEGKAAL